MKQLDKYTGSESFLILTLDSCRWDVFNESKTPCLSSLCDFKAAYTQGTYTLPSHISIFSGILPNTRDSIPYYNRFCKNLFRISDRSISRDSYIQFPPNTKNIIDGFKQLGYSSFGTGAMRWFKNTILTESFEDFYYSGICFEEQVKYLVKNASESKVPRFMFANIGETHEPFEFGGKVHESIDSRELIGNADNVFLQENYEKQKSCVEYLDEKIYRLLLELKEICRDVVVVICADHGECFGEDGLFGHGFYHEKVMEVPLGIFKL